MAGFTLLFTPTTTVYGRSGYNKDGDDDDDKGNKGRSGYNKDGENSGGSGNSGGGQNKGRSGYNKSGKDDDDDK